MIAVAAVAVILRMAVTAFHVWYDPECRWLAHVWVREDGPDVVPRPTTTTHCVAPFWPQYWRKLLEIPWPGTFACDCLTGESRMISIGVVTECRPHRLVGSRAVSPDEAWGVGVSLQSLKTFNGQTAG
jgi:hypothetical protein